MRGARTQTCPVKWNPSANRVENFAGTRCREAFDDHALVVLTRGELHVLPGSAMQILHVGQSYCAKAVPARRQGRVFEHSETDRESAIGLPLQRTQPTEVLCESQGRAQRDTRALAEFRQGEIRLFNCERVEQTERPIQKRFT